jgi:hypothetical protein
MDYTTIYFVGFIVTVGAFAIRARDVESRTLFIIAATWPVMVPFALFIFALDLIKWDMDIVKSTQLFGFRKPTNPKTCGFALTVFAREIQFYSQRKLVD